MKVLTMGTLIAVTITVAMAGAAGAQNDNQGRHCDTTTLRGPYVFAASGFDIVGGVPRPKAIVELIDFHGDGALTVTGGTVSIGGAIVPIPPNGAGNYTLDPDCNGTLAFIGGPSFNIFIGDGKSGWLIQTNPSSVFQGTLNRRR